MQQLELIVRKKKINKEIRIELNKILPDLQAMLVNDLFIYSGILIPTVLRTNIWKWIEREDLHGIFRSFIYKNKLYIVRVA